MLTLALLGACAVVLGGAFMLHLRRVRASLHGPRIVACPETGVPAAVELDTGFSAVRSAFGRPHLRVSGCSRWPARAGCGQPCLGDIEASPADTRVTRVVSEFYAGKHCVFCGWEFDATRSDHDDAALLGPDGITHEWTAIATDTLPSLLRIGAPVCWSCHVVRTFRRNRPDIFRLPDGPVLRVM